MDGLGRVRGRAGVREAEGVAGASDDDYQPNPENEWTLRQMRDRRSFDLVEFGYRDVLECPFGHFAELAGRGWPIDPVVAAKVVDPARIRYRAEALTAGVR